MLIYFGRLKTKFFFSFITVFLLVFLSSLSLSIEKKVLLSNEYIPFKIKFKYLENVKSSSFSNTYSLIKYHLENVQILIGKLFYTSKKLKQTVITKEILKKFNLEFKPTDKILSEKKVTKTHLTIIVSLKKLSEGKILESTLYNKNAIIKNNEDDDVDDDDDSDSKSGKRFTFLALLNINIDFKFSQLKFKEEFDFQVIKELLYMMGFRKSFLKIQKIRNDFESTPYYLIKDLKSFKSYEKWLKLTNKKFNKARFIENGLFYLNNWPRRYLLNDIMTNNNNIYPEATFTELTGNLFEDLIFFSINKCSIFKYKAGFGGKFSCLNVDQKCIDPQEFLEKGDYFLEYGIYNGHNIKCYLNSKENISRKQCGTLYGNLCNMKLEYRFCPLYRPIKNKPLISHTPIPEIFENQKQNLKLLKKPDVCPDYSPRTIYFSVPKSVLFDYSTNINPQMIDNIFESLQKENGGVQYTEISLNEDDKKYFVTYQSLEEYYSRISVMEVLQNSGIIRSFSHLNSHNLLLKIPIKEVMGDIPRYQKFFKFINYLILSKKDNTYIAYKNMQNLFPNDYNYISETFLYPENQTLIEEKFGNYKIDLENLWLIKPKAGSLGKGIYIFQSLENTPSEYLLTKYINHPHLINGYKYDFRVYVLITGIAPLKIYLYKEGLARFASEKYILDLKTLKQGFRHLTNISLNKKNKEGFIIANDIDTEEGNRWSLLAYEKYCKKKGINYKYIRNQMKDLVIKIILSAHKEYYDKLKEEKFETRNFFHLSGFDFILDQNLRLYFLEGNDRPSLLMGDINDRKLKPQLVADVLNIVGIVPYSHDYNDDFIAYDYKDNKDKWEKIFKNESKEEQIIHDVEESLCEFGRPRGKFELIFPLKENIEKYKKFFRIYLPENELLWEKIQKE